MKTFFGIIFVDKTEVLLRVYQINKHAWQLLYATSHDFARKNHEKTIPTYTIAQIIANFFSTTYPQKIIEWKICAREMPYETVTEIALATGLTIEYIDRYREKELLCKGIFTELW